MKRHFFSFNRVIFCGLVLCCAAVCGRGAGQTVAELQKRIAAHLDEPRFAQAQWGVKVVSLDTGKTIFERNADKLMKPASNAKMYTAGLALDRLGEDYRIKTSFYADAKPNADGVLAGRLIVYGRGDPSFAARFNDGDYDSAMAPAVDAIVAAGIKRIDGDIIGDESYFAGPPFGNEWAWDDLENYYGAGVSALTYQDNVIDLVFKPGKTIGAPCQILTMPETTFMIFSNRTSTVAAGGRVRIRIYRPLGENVTYIHGHAPLGSNGENDAVAVHDPALWFVTMLKQALVRRGIAVSGGLRTINWLDDEAAPLDVSKLIEVAAVDSRPLSEIVKLTLKPSQNLYAQLLLLQVGRVSQERARRASLAAGNGRPARMRRRAETTEGAGLEEMAKFLVEAGIPANTALLDDGSGLSRSCLVTPAASVRLLTYMSHHRAKVAFLDALPVAGVDGTLRNRFTGTQAAGNARAKTGSLRYVDTISGYVTTQAGEKLVFSVMLNNYGPNYRSGAFDGASPPDAVVRLLAEFGGRSGEQAQRPETTPGDH